MMSSTAHNEQQSRFGSLRTFFARLATRWQRERTRAVLESLSDDLVRDIGITRSEIPYVADRLTRPATSQDTRKRNRAQSHVPQMEVAG
jgi:uncharacterized protein YjiS (DUF1127 family)